MQSSECPGGKYDHNKCPGDERIKCCFSVPYQEAECLAQDGQCLIETECGGELLSGFCPSQPEGIKCCKVPLRSDGNKN